MNPTGPNVLLRWLLASCSALWDELPKKKKVTYLKLYFFAGSLNACFTKSAALSGLSHSNWGNCSAIPFILAPNSCFNYGKIYLLLVRMLQRLSVHPRNYQNTFFLTVNIFFLTVNSLIDMNSSINQIMY